MSVLEQINAIVARTHGTGFAEIKCNKQYYIVTYAHTQEQEKFDIENHIKNYIFTHERYGDV